MSLPEPRVPSHVRLARPEHWRSGATGRLKPDVRDFYMGLATMADDDGWLRWLPSEIGANLYCYEPVARRERDLIQRGQVLQGCGLLVLHDCGCGELPRMREDLATRGGRPAAPVHRFHVDAHATTYAPVHAPLVKVSEVKVSEVKDAAGQRDVAAPAALGDEVERAERAWAVLAAVDTSEDIKRAARAELQRFGMPVERPASQP